MTYRILVTGCRDWEDGKAVYQALTNAWCEAMKKDHNNMRASQITIVHGNATGADAYARIFAGKMQMFQEPFPANWQTHGKAAGPIRNQEMVNLGADICLAFWDGQSKGTADCIAKAVRAGIPVSITPKGKP